MDLGEHLKNIEDRVYNCAVTELKSSGVSPTLGYMIMEAVLGRFAADAYTAVNRNREAEAMEKNNRN